MPTVHHDNHILIMVTQKGTFKKIFSDVNTLSNRSLGYFIVSTVHTMNFKILKKVRDPG